MAWINWLGMIVLLIALTRAAQGDRLEHFASANKWRVASALPLNRSLAGWDARCLHDCMADR